MKSQTRQDCETAVKYYADLINSKTREPSDVFNRPKMLYVGIAGDPIRGEYSPLFPKFKIVTFDSDPKWKPDVVGDITKSTWLDEVFDAIVCVQVIEHIPNIFDLPKEVHRILKPGGYLIIDCPWNYPYHPEPPSFGDYWRITKDGFAYLFGQYFDMDYIIYTEHNTSCLMKRK